ncbi:hypothetical protein EV121DRAFT_211856 [Schizophyllum commune]
MNRRFTELSALLQQAPCLANIDLLRDDYIPSPEEHAAILEMSSKLSAYESTAPRVLRERLQTQLAVNQSIISPLRHIPSEIFSEIFVVLADMEELPYNRASMICKTIACVCRDWRAIAHATPQLWTYISHYHRPIWTAGNFDHVKQMALAGDLPLSIRLDLTGSDDHERAEKVLREFHLAAARWKFIECEGIPCSILEMQATVAMPQLEEALITLNDAPTGRPLDFIAQASALNMLTLGLVQNQSCDLDWSRISLPTFPSLERFIFFVQCGAQMTATSQTMPVVLATLRNHRSSLIWLAVYIYGISPPEPEPLMSETPIEMLSLGALRLGDAIACVVLDYLLTPVLDDIAISGGPVSFNPLPHVHSLLSRQTLRIRRLLLKDFVAPDGLGSDFVACLKLLDHLEELLVGELGRNLILMTAQVIRELSLKEGHRPLLPKLSTFRLRVIHEEAMSPVKSALDDMLQCRQSTRTCASQGLAKLEIVEVAVGEDAFGSW